MNARVVVLFVSIIFSVPITPCVSADPAEVTGVFYLKVRSAPDFDAEETGVLAAGDVVDVIGEVGRWANVALEDGRTGYVSRKYLSPVTATAPSDGGLEEPAAASAVPAAPAVPAVPAVEEDVREQATEVAEAADRAEPVPASDTEGSGHDPPPPPEKPQVIRTRPPPEHGPAPCTSADIEGLRRELEEMAAAQSRLAGLMAADTREEPASRDWSSSISTRQMLFWLGAGCAIGWLAAVGLRHRRERRQRGRIRI